jgi:hypothetical protein
MNSRLAATSLVIFPNAIIINENLFDFGLLLINKNSENRNTDETIKNMNN